VNHPHRLSVRHLVAVLTLALASTLLAGVVPATAAPPVPAPVTTYRTAPEPLAPYVGQLICTSRAQTGTLAFAQLIRTTYGSGQSTPPAPAARAGGASTRTAAPSTGCSRSPTRPTARSRTRSSAG
jgi:hypothetical protein